MLTWELCSSLVGHENALNFRWTSVSQKHLCLSSLCLFITTTSLEVVWLASWKLTVIVFVLQRDVIPWVFRFIFLRLNTCILRVLGVITIEEMNSSLLDFNFKLYFYLSLLRRSAFEKLTATLYGSLWKRVIAWERSRAAIGYGIIWGDADRNKQEEFSAECHSVDCF